MKTMLPFLVLLAVAGLEVGVAQSQTPIGAPLPEGSSSVNAQQLAQQEATEQSEQSFEPSGNVTDIDATLKAEKEMIGLPLSDAEKRRGDAARKLAAQMSANLNSLVEEVENVALPKVVTQYQKAWETRKPTDGVSISKACTDCIYPVQPRELMVTSIQLPRIEKISGFDLGDRQSFRAEIRNDFTLAIKPMIHNVDTNLNIYTESGMVYPFYLRSLPLNSSLIPDVVVRIEDNGLVPGRFGVKSMFEVQKVIEEHAPQEIAVSEVLDNLRGADESDQDFVRSIEFDPATLTGFDGYHVSGSADRQLTPKVVFRDGQFTYIQWKDWDSGRLPVAYAVKDRKDYLVNTRVRGKTYIIESTADLISLKIGNSYLCLKWKGDE